MTPKSWLNLALFALLVALLTGIYFDQRSEPPATTSRLIANPPEVSEIEFQRPGAAALKLQRNGDQWRLIEPINAPADPNRVAALLALLNAESRSSYPLDGLDLMQFGLMPPQGALRLNELEIAFGNTELTSNRRYVVVNDRLHLLYDRYLPLLAAGGRELVDHRPFAETAQLRAIQTPSVRIVLHNAKWQLVKADGPQTSDAAEQLAESWRFAIAEMVESYSGNAIGEPLSFELADGSRLDFRIIERNPLTLVPVGGNYQLRFSAAMSGELLDLPTSPKEP